MPTPDTDIVAEARELLALMTNDTWSFSTLPRARQVVAALADEVEACRSEIKTLELTVGGLLDRLGCHNED